jgi:hypothetical protein
VRFLWFYCVYGRFEYVQNLGGATLNTVLNAGSPDEHNFDQGFYPWEAAPAGHLMAADELATAVFAEVVLRTVAFFPVPGYAGAMTTGHVIYGY